MCDKQTDSAAGIMKATIRQIVCGLPKLDRGGSAMGEWHKTQCNFCGLSCGLEVKTADNRVINVRPDPDSPRTPHTYCCRKGRSYKYLQDSEERLDYPLKRVGDRFERITWEQAYSEIAEKARRIIDEHGPRAFGYCGGALASGQGDAAFCKKMLDAIGSQNYYNPIGLEFAGNWWSHGKIIGTQALYTEGDEERVDVLIFWGSNSYVAHNFLESRKIIRAFSEDPEKMIIVVDPRMSETARMADFHVMARPGCDALLLRGLIALILDKGWQDQTFINRWVADWEPASMWYKGFDYQKAFEVCRVPLAQMEKLAQILTTRTWGLHQDLGIFCGRHNTANSYLLLTLMAITGNLLYKGNLLLDGYAQRGITTDENDPGVWRTPETGRFPVLGSFPTGVMASEILSNHPDRMRCLFVSMSNPARSWVDSKKVAQALDKLELLVVIDIFMSETAKHADYVLPGKTGWEAYEFNIFQATGANVTCMLKHPFIGQIGERKENTRIWFDIVDRMGYIPELPQSLYDSAKKAVENKDRIPFLLDLLSFMKKHKEYSKALPLIICKAMLEPMGSINRTMLWAALITSPLMGTGMPERAGFGPGKKHPILTKVPKLQQIAIMDNIFQAVDDTPQGVVVGIPEPDPEKYTQAHIYHKDKKFHLWCAEMDQYIRRITPDKEEQALALDPSFPLILSSGRHADGGDNTSMRNPATHVYRDPFVVTINPEDAAELGIADGQLVRLTTKVGSVEAPAEVSCTAGRGYALIPHQYGLEYKGKVYGAAANELTSWEDLDELTGNPLIRYVPCRVEVV